ncbi:hypothetical protein FRX31_032972 [Thalictrum thalictroides]|uniref:DUF8039 domain-containing protein n=1 Tax=Thalictrum thalictroides TaxID=46969 RepID=A0A7J6UYF7_THATH|nr:hypothetical protein FRX31_032972 [Thalictrum thalictroides]
MELTKKLREYENLFVEKGIPSTLPQKNVKNCSLALGSKSNIVAKGSFFERNGDDDKIHLVDLGKDNVKVSIVLPLKPQTLLPIPIGDHIITTVGKIVGTFVAWPKEFVISDERNEGIENNEEENNVAMAGDEESKLAEFVEMLNDIMEEDEIYPLDKDIFKRDKLEFHIAKDEIVDVCNNRMLNVSVLIAYMRQLYNMCESSRLRYGFCYPANVEQFDDDKTKKNSQMHSAIAKRLQVRQGSSRGTSYSPALQQQRSLGFACD